MNSRIKMVSKFEWIMWNSKQISVPSFCYFTNNHQQALYICIPKNIAQKKWKTNQGGARTKIMTQTLNDDTIHIINHTIPKFQTPCALCPTAADDVRGRLTCKGCEKTGMIGMACWYDHFLQFTNIVESGQNWSKQHLLILYHWSWWVPFCCGLVILRF